MSWFDKILPPGLKRSNNTSRAKQVPEGLWVKCPACDAVLYSTELEKNLNVCPKCEHHMRRVEVVTRVERPRPLAIDVLVEACRTAGRRTSLRRPAVRTGGSAASR